MRRLSAAYGKRPRSRSEPAGLYAVPELPSGCSAEAGFAPRLAWRFFAAFLFGAAFLARVFDEARFTGAGVAFFCAWSASAFFAALALAQRFRCAAAMRFRAAGLRTRLVVVGEVDVEPDLVPRKSRSRF